MNLMSLQESFAIELFERSKTMRLLLIESELESTAIESASSPARTKRSTSSEAASEASVLEKADEPSNLFKRRFKQNALKYVSLSSISLFFCFSFVDAVAVVVLDVIAVAAAAVIFPATVDVVDAIN